ncbi:MAG: uL15 family ribosomal protein [Candidatus Pacearchaeota archaeon]|nr:uL15 family ribosomal protein [Candidatus Pacearchaeota archaeon]
MKIKKRKKSTRYRGSQTHRRGHRKRTRGLGNKGGVGMSGTGKRSGQKKTLVMKLYGAEYFGKDKALRRGRVKPKLNIINLSQINASLDKYKKTKDGYEINLKGYKILGDGDITEKLIITASSFSKSAKEKIEKAGGKCNLS